MSVEICQQCGRPCREGVYDYYETNDHIDGPSIPFCSKGCLEGYKRNIERNCTQCGKVVKGTDNLPKVSWVDAGTDADLYFCCAECRKEWKSENHDRLERVKKKREEENKRWQEKEEKSRKQFQALEGKAMKIHLLLFVVLGLLSAFFVSQKIVGPVFYWTFTTVSVLFFFTSFKKCYPYKENTGRRVRKISTKAHWICWLIIGVVLVSGATYFQISVMGRYQEQQKEQQREEQRQLNTENSALEEKAEKTLELTKKFLDSTITSNPDFIKYQSNIYQAIEQLEKETNLSNVERMLIESYMLSWAKEMAKGDAFYLKHQQEYMEGGDKLLEEARELQQGYCQRRIQQWREELKAKNE